MRRDIRHAIGLQDVVVYFPLWLTIYISLCDIEEVCSNVYWQHRFFINLINSEARVFALISSCRRKNRVECDRPRLVVVAY